MAEERKSRKTTGSSRKTASAKSKGTAASRSSASKKPATKSTAAKKAASTTKKTSRAASTSAKKRSTAAKASATAKKKPAASAKTGTAKKTTAKATSKPAARKTTAKKPAAKKSAPKAAAAKPKRPAAKRASAKSASAKAAANGARATTTAPSAAGGQSESRVAPTRPPVNIRPVGQPVASAVTGGADPEPPTRVQGAGTPREPVAGPGNASSAPGARSAAGAGGGGSDNPPEMPAASETPAPSIGPNTVIERESPEDRLARGKPSETDAMGLDKRRPVIGGSYGPSRTKQITLYGIAVAVVIALGLGGYFLAKELDQAPETYPDEAPWSQSDAANQPPQPLE